MMRSCHQRDHFICFIILVLPRGILVGSGLLNFIVKAIFLSMDVNENKFRFCLTHSSCCPSNFFVEILTEDDSVAIIEFGFEDKCP
jgi:hypothetical protein